MNTRSPQQELDLCVQTLGPRLTAFVLGCHSALANAQTLDALQDERLKTLTQTLRVLQTRHGSDHNRTRAWLLAPSFGDGSLSAVEMIASKDPADALAVLRCARAYVQ